MLRGCRLLKMNSINIQSVAEAELLILSLCQFDGIHVVSGSLDTSIRVWDVETGNCIHTLTGHQSLTSGMELKDNILVSGNADSTVKIWDIKTGQCLQTLQGERRRRHNGLLHQLCLSFNNNCL